MNAPFRIERASSAHAAELCALFARVGTACHCEWWHFEGDKNAWLDRLAHRPTENREALCARLASEDAEPHGLIAIDASSRVIGWMKLTPSERVHKIYEQRIYRRLPCFDGPRDGVLTVGCFLVEERSRRRGVASALLRAGVAHGKELGARALEAFPRAGLDLRDEEVWTGPLALFLRAGFEIVGGGAPYPVLRKALIQEGAPEPPAK